MDCGCGENCMCEACDCGVAGCCEENGMPIDACEISIGNQVPDFNLDAYFKGEFTNVSLSDYEGKWKVVFFYPLDFTFVCPTEILDLSARVSEFDALNTQILSVSIDSVHSHKAWSKEIGDLNFPMLSDLNKDISSLFKVLHEDGMSLRGTFIIDPDNVLQSMTVNNLAVGRSTDELKRTLEAFQSGDLCPINWKKGEKTLGKA